MRLRQLATIAVATAGLFSACCATAADESPVRLGIIFDLGGPYADLEGPAAAEAVRWAVRDFGGKVLGRPIEVLVADHQNKPDIAAAKAREWADKNDVKMLMANSSGAAIAVSKVSAEKRIPMFTSAGSSRLTNEDCTPYTIQYPYDAVSMARVAAAPLVKAGSRSWFFLTADYAVGYSLEGEAAKVVKDGGGSVLGSARHPLNAADFSSFMLQAQATKPQVLAMANAGGDFINAVKSAREFGIAGNVKMVGLLVMINDVHSLGLSNTSGLLLADSWYWDQDDASREFAARFFARFKRMPSSVQAGDYSATMNYLKAVQAAGTLDSEKVMTSLKSMRIDDFYNKGYIRADGRMMHDMYLYEVKSPKESTKPWDYYKTIARVPAEQAFLSADESKCPLLRK